MRTDDPSQALQPSEKYEIPEVGVVDQRTIQFLDDELTIALGDDGYIYCSMPSLCHALGLIMSGQRERILRTTLLRPGLTYMRLKTPKRGLQRTLCFRIDLIPSWLIGAETEIMRVGAGAKVHEYQTRLMPVAVQIFIEVMGINPRALLSAPQAQPTIAPSEAEVILQQVADLREEYENLTGVVTMMRESMEAMLGELGGKLDQATELMQRLVDLQQGQQDEIGLLKAKTEGLTKAQQAEVSRAIRIIVKDSQQTGHPLKYQQVYGVIMARFNVKSYADIPDSRYEEVMIFLRDFWRKVTTGQLPEQGNLF